MTRDSFIQLHLNPLPSDRGEYDQLNRTLPLLRLQPGCPAKVLALFDSEVTVSSRWFGRTLKTGDFSSDTLSQPWRTWRVGLKDIVSVTLVEPGSGRLADKAWRFLIQAGDGSRRFVCHGEDGQRVLRYFQQRLPERVARTDDQWTHFTWRLRSSLIWPAAMTFVLCFALAVSGLISTIGKVSVAVELALLGRVYGLGIFAWLVLVVFPVTLHRYEPGSQPTARRPNGPFNWAKIRRPFWFYLLGWSLKLVALGWYCLCAFWIERQEGIWPFLEVVHSFAGLWFWIALYSPALFMIYWGYRICRAAPRRGTAAETGTEILYLRAFDEDESLTLQPTSWLAICLGVAVADIPFMRVRDGARFRHLAFYLFNLHPVRFIRLFLNKGADTAEEVLTSFFTDFGRVVALGLPGERFGPPGAERLITGGDAWQQLVTEHIERAQMVIIQPGTSLGVRWEITKTLEIAEPQRVLFNLAAFWRHPPEFEDFLSELPDRIRANVPREVPYLGRPALLYFERDWTVRLQLISYRSPLLWLLLGDAVDLRYTLWPFLEGVNGGVRQSPRQPKKYPVQALLAWLGIAGIIALYGLGQSLLTQRASLRNTGATEAIVRKSILASPMVEYKGRRVPYSIQLRRAWLQQDIPKDKDSLYEDYWFEIDDFSAGIEINSTEVRDTGLAAFADVRLKGFQQTLHLKSDQVRLVDSSALVIHGKNWTAVHLEAKLGNGAILDEYSRAYSGASGTVFLVGVVANKNALYSQLVEESLNSIQVDDDDSTRTKRTPQ